MLVVGAEGFAKEILQILHENMELDQLVFYDDISPLKENKLFDKFTLLHSLQDAEQYLKTIDNRFTIGIGNPGLRDKMYRKFKALGGLFTSTISQKIDIGNFEVNIGPGTNILSGVKISNGVSIGTGCMIYYNAIVAHDVQIGKFVEISPGATLLGRCKIGDFTHIGAGAIILPDIIVGNHVMVAAGAVVINNVQSNVMVAGVPAIVKKAYT